MKKHGTVVAAETWLEGLIHESPTFHAQVEERLAALRVSRGLSQTQLAAQLGITQSAIAQLEAAQPKNVELRTLVRVATALGAQVEVSIRTQPAPRRPRTGRPGRAKKVVAMRKSA
ncbi:MAG: XRE family transcriptional regulator [Vicinamibacterales bacterium]